MPKFTVKDYAGAPVTFKHVNLVQFHSGNKYLYNKAYEIVSYGFMSPELIAIWAMALT